MNENLPVLILKKIVFLPYQELRLELNNDVNKEIIDIALKKYNNKILIIAPLDTLETTYSELDLPNIGVIGKIRSKIELPNGNVKIIINGLNRVNINRYSNLEENENILIANVKMLYIKKNEDSEQLAIIQTLKSHIEKYIKRNPSVSNSIKNTINNIKDLDVLTDVIVDYMPFNLEKKLEYMNEFDEIIRANNLIRDISLELEVINIESKIDEELRVSFEKDQRDYIIKQKIDKLNEELGNKYTKEQEINKYMSLIDELETSSKTKEKLYNEINRYSYMSDNNPDTSLIRNYIDTILDLPWNSFSEDELDIKKIKKVLDKNHFGLEKIKTRILEYIAIKKNNPNANSPIICLVGPPGTGKTTLAMSIGEALNKEFYKISVGGMNDSSELVGHKRTYLGSSPGKIIQGLKRCGVKNPVFLIDEVDKIVSNYNGDPSSTLLDILDENQNKLFIDNYIEEPFDLSNIFFILTANDISQVPYALKDRLEIIEVSSYTEQEKLVILKKYIIPKILKQYNMKKINISDDILVNIIKKYTRESGVRELERILRKIYRHFLLNDEHNKKITIDTLKSILGPFKYNSTIVSNNYPGTVYTLGVSNIGGNPIKIESIILNGEGNIEVSGNVLDSVVESCKISYNHICAYNKEYNIELKKLNSQKILINFMNYSLKKDGTSCGVAIITSIISLLQGKVLEDDICFTGEITLHGDIIKVGGIKEKIIGAYNNGFKKIYIPKDNESDLENVPKEILNNLEIKVADNYIEIYNDIFKKHK